MAKKTKAKAEKTETATVTTPSTISLANVARDDCGKSPKAVRGRFRKLYNADGTPKDPNAGLPLPVKGGSRWTFAAKDRDALIKLIGTDNGDTA